jgi:hypothetical protein
MTNQNALANAKLLFKALAAREANLDEPIPSSRKIAFVWIAVQVIKHHICLLTARDPRRRAARIRAVAGVLATKAGIICRPDCIT